MKTSRLLPLAAAALLAGCGGGFSLFVAVGDDHHDHWDDRPMTLTQISACPDSGNGYLSHVYRCMTGTASGQVSYSNQVCSLVITDSGRITLGIAGSNHTHSFYVYPDNAYYTKLPGMTQGSFTLNTSNQSHNFAMNVTWPGAVLVSGMTVATMSVAIGSLSCNFVL